MTTASANKRLLRELQEITNTPSEDFSAGPLADNDLLNWESKLYGPKGSPYVGGIFSIALVFNAEYPFKPPKVKFNTKIYHPNVDEDGSICIGVLKPDVSKLLFPVWKPSNKIVDILNSLVLVLAEPNADDAINTSVAEVMNSNRDKYTKTCQEWVQKYASV